MIMSGNEQAKPFNDSIEKNTASEGTMKGTIVNTRTQETTAFDTTLVFRSEPGGRMRVLGEMRFPGQSEVTFIRVEFQLANKDAPSATYSWGAPEVVDLHLINQFNPFYKFDASQGEIRLQNHAHEERINGSVIFTTVVLGNDQYSINVIFDITGK
jgi:hypothetical protein